MPSSPALGNNISIIIVVGFLSNLYHADRVEIAIPSSSRMRPLGCNCRVLLFRPRPRFSYPWTLP